MIFRVLSKYLYTRLALIELPHVKYKRELFEGTAGTTSGGGPVLFLTLCSEHLTVSTCSELRGPPAQDQLH